jgi:hypothetical protein
MLVTKGFDEPRNRVRQCAKRSSILGFWRSRIDRFRIPSGFEIGSWSVEHLVEAEEKQKSERNKS